MPKCKHGIVGHCVTCAMEEAQKAGKVGDTKADQIIKKEDKR